MLNPMTDGPNDPVKELVLKFLLSYGGIAGGVSFLIEGLKAMFKDWVSGRENILVIVLSFVLGAAAKALMPGIYGANSVNAWGLHLLILVFVAVGAAAFHDGFLSTLMSFVPKKAPPADGGDDAAQNQKGGP
jgi:hypothetical protein